MINRQEFVNNLRKWKGAVWHHNARIRYQAVDCVNLVIAGIEDTLDVDIPNLIYLGRMPQNNALQRTIEKNFQVTYDPQIGDLLLVRYQQIPHHVLIKTTDTSYIHAYNRGQGIVIEEPISHLFTSRTVNWYNLNSIDLSKGFQQ